MALFGKKQDPEAAKQEALRKQQQEAARQQTLAPFEIHVMPQKFKPAPAPKQSSGAMRTGMIGLLIFMVLALLGIGAFQLYRSLNQPAPVPPVANTNNAANTNIPANTNTPANANNANVVSNTNAANANANTNAANLNTNTAANTNATNTNAATNTNVPANTNTTTKTKTAPTAVTVQSSLDTDRDGLTDVEELLYTTNTRLPDTDGDGYTDGQEILGLFSPIAANQTLQQSGLVNTYSDAGFSVFYPASWLARATDASKTQILFTSSTGEVMKAEVIENPTKQTLGQYISTNEPTLNPADFSDAVTKSGLRGLASSNQQIYFVDLSAAGKIVKLSYMAGSATRLSFLTTLRMMFNSLRLP